MNKKQAKELWAIIKAFGEGVALECKRKDVADSWHNYDGDDLSLTYLDYRIKPTPTYRSFANVEECWEEMKKHEPFGWLKEKGKNKYVDVKRIDGEFMTVLLGGDDNWGMKGAFNNYIFADGTPFGKLTEEE